MLTCLSINSPCPQGRPFAGCAARRTGLVWSAKYPAPQCLNVKTAYLDGELRGVDESGLPSFAQTKAAPKARRLGRVPGISLVPTQTVLENLVLAKSRRQPASCGGARDAVDRICFRRARTRHRSRQARVAVVTRRAAARRNRQGDARRLACPHPGRADRIADRSRDGDIVRTHSPPQGQRRGRHLHLPQDPRFKRIADRITVLRTDAILAQSRPQDCRKNNCSP